MSRPVWIQKLKARIERNPLFFDEDGKVRCQQCGGTGRRVPLYRITNYNEFRKCAVCGIEHK